MENYNLSERLVIIRNNCGKTQIQFAKKLGVVRQTLQRYESGDSTPSIEILRKYRELGKVSWSFLLDEKEQEDVVELFSLIMLLSPSNKKTIIELLKIIVKK